MEDSTEDLNVVPELYFLIAKFLSGGPLKETAKTLLKELESVEVLPRRLDWQGGDHRLSYEELASHYTDVSWTRLASVCDRALKLARLAPSLPVPLPSSGQGQGQPSPGQPQQLQPASQEQSLRLTARLSLLSDSLVRSKPKYSSYKQDHSLVRRLVSRELGSGTANLPGGRGGPATFPPRLLSGLQLQRRTLGHLSAVYCLVFDCSGRYVVTGADDLLVKVWSATEGRLVGTLRGAGAEITDACVSRDATLLAVGSVERLVRVWCLRSGAERAVLHAHAGTITSVHWAPPARTDVRWLASTSTDGSVAFWTCSPDGQFLSRPVQYVERMRPGVCHMICAAWSAGGGFLAAGSADHHVRVYRLEPSAQAPRRVLEVAVHGDAVDSIAWAHSGLRFVSGSKDGSAALWGLHATQWRPHVLRCGPAPATLASHPSHPGNAEPKKLKVTMVCWDCSDAYVITAVSDNTVRVWCSRTCQQVRALSGHRDEAYVLEAHPFLPAVFLSAGHDGQLFVWDAQHGEVLAHFHNQIEGQGDGAIFDAKWGTGATVAASDSHGHLLLLGLGQGHRLLRQLPTELFFHTDYRPLVRDALGSALDEQTELPPHLMPPPFLVDVEGAPHEPHLQRLVPGRENLLPSQLVPAADAPAARSRLDLMIEALAADRTPPGEGGFPEGRGPWRGQGVRHTAGSWQSGEPCAPCERPLVPPLSATTITQIEAACAELNAQEQSWYRREMRRRPVMITTAIDGGPRRKPGRRPAAGPSARAAVRAQPQPARASPEPEESLTSDTSDESVRLSGTDRSYRSGSERIARARPARPAPRARARPRPRRDLTSPRSTDEDTSISYSDSKTGESSDSSQYSDWEAGAALAPPARARRRPIPTARYSPSAPASKRAAGGGAPGSAPRAAPDLPEAYRPGEWLCAVSPRKAPYHPQMGDHCVYFRLGHQRYFEAVSEKDLYKVNPRDKPWERTYIYDCEQVKVVGIKYVIKPPRVVCLRLAATLQARTFTVRYHDMPDVIDFLVLRQQYEAATARPWGPGERFRCMIDDSWWTGTVLERVSGAGCSASGAGGTGGVPETLGTAEAREWAAAAAAHFLSLRVRWDNGEVERLSPWDLEQLDPERLPSSPSASVPVLPHELEAALYRASASEWPPRGDRASACRAIAQHIGAVMSLSVAEPFVAPVDLQQYPSYALVVPYPIDLATIRARFENLFYRRTAAAQFDVRYLASNAEQFNEMHSPIVRQARLVTDLLLFIISNWRDVDVLGKYHELAANYRSSDDEPLAASASLGSSAWRGVCARVLRQLLASPDAEPFRQPVSADQAPDYHVVVPAPMDLGTAQLLLEAGRYSSAQQFAADVRRVFTNSRLYNTNKRSRDTAKIYSMTVRLSSLFESVWSRVEPAPAPAPSGSGSGHAARRTRRAARQARRAVRATRHAAASGAAPAGAGAGHSASSDSETLAATSRRVHAGAGAGADADEWDSDLPLRPHRKGKGVGKKSKRCAGAAPAPSAPAPASASTSRLHDSYLPPSNGFHTDSEQELEVEQQLEVEDTGGGRGGAGSESSDEYRDISVVERELVDEEVELQYSTGEQRVRERKRRRCASHSRDSASSRERRTSRRRRRTKRSRRSRRSSQVRIRERFTDGSSTSSHSDGSEGGAGRLSGRHYESDRSYRPRYSTDDDAPLHLYRQRQQGAGDDEAGPSSRRHNGHARRGRVSLRARSPRRYNEDSEEDSIAAISKRLPPRHPAALAAAGPRPLLTRMDVRPSTSARAHALNDDHNYFNGHAHASYDTRGHAAPHSGAHTHSTNGGRDAESGGAGAAGDAAPGAVSISSRGRIRKLTAKARGLLRD